MKKSVAEISSRLIKFARPILPEMALSISAGITGHIAAISVMVSAALFLSGASGADVPVSASFWGWSMMISAFIRGILHYLEQYKGHDIAFRLLAKIRSELFESLRRLAPAKLVEKKSGDMVTSLMSDIELIEVFFAHTVAPVTIAAVMFCLLVAFFSLIHPAFGFIMAFFYLLEALIIPCFGFGFARKKAREYRGTISDLNSRLTDSLQGMKELILFGKAEKTVEEIKDETRRLHASSLSLKLHEGFVSGICGAVITLASLSVLFAGITLYQEGTLQGYEVFTAFVAALSSFAPFTALSALSNTITNTFAAAERIFAIKDERPSVQDSGNAAPMRSGLPTAECDNITFGYKEKTILKNLSLFVKPGSKVAITGESGSGKTTLLRLMLRFWDVDSGTVKIKNQNVRDVTLCSLRENITSLSQETYLFNKTIAENIALGRKNATMEEIIEAAKKAEIHDFITTLPDGYDTLAGELGGKLSGGERQRIGIARTLLNNADIILLDEMTSSLDTLNESAILKTIMETMKEKTVITVTHRESVAAKSDVVFHIKKEA